MAFASRLTNARSMRVLSICTPLLGAVLIAAAPAMAQLSGPPCGWNYGVEITPQNSPFMGCTVPSNDSPYGVRLRQDPFSPGGIRGESAAPAPLPVLQPASPVIINRYGL
jgi:hypothetical protein